jgi:hypothetical protein
MTDPSSLAKNKTENRNYHIPTLQGSPIIDPIQAIPVEKSNNIKIAIWSMKKENPKT